MPRSHAHQYFYVGDRLTFKTVATRAAIALLLGAMSAYLLCIPIR
ncbi:MAG: hypothetical protein V7L00_29690 [Nostoc sp.]